MQRSGRIPWTKDTRRGHAGQALAWVVVMLPIFVGVIGLTFDAGVLFINRREAQNIADAAARSAAAAIDEGRYRETDGEVVQLDAGAARLAAQEYLGEAGWTDATITIGPTVARVEARRRVRLAFLGLFGVPDYTIGASATAAPFFGYAEGRHP